MRLPVFTLAALAIAALAAGGVDLEKLPNKSGSVKIAVIGDSGTGAKPAFDVAAKLAEARARFPFETVLMLGDNMYGGESARDFAKKFEQPYKALLDSGVKFRAVLGNHDSPEQRFYKPFNMDGRRYYTFQIKNTDFFALDSNYMDKPQLDWLEGELRKSKAAWKIAFFHHPLYSSGEKHGSDVQLRAFLEPLFVKYSVNVVLSGHEHFYERIKPQKGIWYFICGSSAKLRERNIAPTELTAKGFDTDRAFMLMEIDEEQIYFEALSRTGQAVDSGAIPRTVMKPARAGA